MPAEVAPTVLKVTFRKPAKFGDHIVAPIQTFKMPKDKALLEKLKEITAKWKEDASKREQIAIANDMSSEKQQVAVDCCTMADAIWDGFVDNDDDDITLIAVNRTNNEIQGIAAYYEDNGPTLARMGVCPSNIDLLAKDQPTRGTGTALIAHIFEDVKKDNRDLDIHSTYSAIPFYRHIGFHQRLRGCSLVISRANLSEFEKLGWEKKGETGEGSSVNIRISASNFEKLSAQDKQKLKDQPSFNNYDQIQPDDVIPMEITAEKREVFLKSHPASGYEEASIDISKLQ